MTTSKNQKTKPAAATTAGKPKTIALVDLCKEVKIKPREARMLLRLAVSKKHEYPALAKTHMPRQPWQWRVGSKELAEAKKALTTLADI